MSSADAIAERGGAAGQVPGSVAGPARASAGRIANEAGAYKDVPSQAVKSSVNRAEQAAWSDALKDPGTGAGPAVTDALVEADKTYGNLAKARSALNAPSTISQSAISVGKPSLGALLGYGAGGVPGALTGAALSTPAVQSVTARGLMGAGSVLKSPAFSSSVPALSRMLRGNR